MKRLVLRSVTLCFVIISLGAAVDAQTTVGGPSSQRKKGRAAEKSPASAEPDWQAEARRSFAVQALLALANEARDYKDETLRAGVQARAADVLWEVDQVLARQLFNRAWEVAEAVDKEGRRRNEEERRRFLSGGGGTGFIPPPPNLRAEVLRLVSRRDRTLAESFLAEMEEEDKREEEEAAELKFWDPTEPPEALRKRLELARQLLEAGETERAILFAARALDRATSQAIMFLVSLRRRDESRADRLFASMLEKAAADPLADATAVSLLASYAFTPSTLVTFTQNGMLVDPWTEALPPPDLSPQLRAAFFRVAAQILLSPVPPSDLERTSAGRAGTYFTMTRLLPLFEQFAPDTAIMLKARLNSLAQNQDGIIPEQVRPFVNAGFARGESPEKESDDFLSRADRAATTYERDHWYALAARAAVMKNDPKARELADRVEGLELKRRVRGFVDFILVTKALERREVESVIRLLHAGELSAFRRAWAYAELAHLLKKTEPGRAQELIGQAMTEAKRVDASSAESPQAWIAIARRTIDVERARMWEMVSEAVKAANRAADYTGEENKITERFESRSHTIAIVDVPAPSVSVAGLFEALAREDFYQAADAARKFSGESPRAVALLAVARAEFNKETTKRSR